MLMDSQYLVNTSVITDDVEVRYDGYAKIRFEK